jgi:hypothetical protein
VKITAKALILILGATALMGCNTGNPPLGRHGYGESSAAQIISQGTYVLEGIGIHAYPAALRVPKRTNENMVIHMEVTNPTGDIEGYQLHGWIQLDAPNNHRRVTIKSGRVSHEGVPSGITWLSPSMGEPSYDWLFFFTDSGRKLAIMDGDHDKYFYLHRQE